MKKSCTDASYVAHIYKRVSFGLRNTEECSMTYRQSKMYNRTKYLKNLPVQSVSSRRNLQVVDFFRMKQTVSF